MLGVFGDRVWKAWDGGKKVAGEVGDVSARTEKK